MSRSGPYQVTLFTTPELLPPGAIKVSAAILDMDRPQPAGDLAVTMQARQLGGPGALESPAAYHQFGADDDYTATLPLPLNGTWRISVLILGRSGPGQASFIFDALRSGAATTLGNWLLWSTPVLIALRLAIPWLRRRRKFLPSAA